MPRRRPPPPPAPATPPDAVRLPLTDAERGLIESHFLLACRLARSHHRRHGGDLDDHLSNALYGLCLAASRYDAGRTNPATGRPYSFGACAGLYVRQQLFMTSHRRRRPGSLAHRQVPWPLLPPPSPDPLPAWVDREAAAVLMARLPADRRRAVRMRLLEGRTLAEIAKNLYCTPAGAGRLVEDGLRRLRRLAGHEDDDEAEEEVRP